MSEPRAEYNASDERANALKKIGADAEARLPMWASGLHEAAKVITTTQPIGSITHDLPRPVPTLRQYLQEQERDMLRRLQRVRDLLAQLPKE